jgi:hypothetical protein
MIDLKKFCDEEGRCSEPFLKDGLAYCTDTRIALAVDPGLYSGDILDEKQASEKKVPKIAPVLADHAKVKEWKKFPKAADCKPCNNTGRLRRLCDECRGMGIVRCNMDHEHDCDWCDDDGMQDVNCQHCPSGVKVGTRKIAMKYFRLCLTLPGVRWGVIGDDRDEIMFLKFDGGFGAVMPLNTDDHQ